MQRFQLGTVVGMTLGVVACGSEEPAPPVILPPPPVEPACEALAPTDNELVNRAYFLAIAPVPESPTAPFLFQSTFSVQGGATTVTVTPLDRGDRTTTVSDTQVLGPFPFEEDGTFTFTLQDVVIPPRANPLADEQVVGDFTLTGVFCEDPRTLFCGTWEGSLTVPDTVPLEGTWAADQVEGGETDFVVDCDQTEGS